MSNNPVYVTPAQKPPNANNCSSSSGNGSGSNANGESKVASGTAVAHTSLDVGGTTAMPQATGQNWTDEMDSPLWLSSLHSVIFIITCALAVFILFRNVLTW